MYGDVREELLRKVKLLSEKLWENRCQGPEVEAWLRNFDGSVLGDADVEQLHALHLLSALSYFGLRELRVLLRALFRDLFRYPLIQQIRREQQGSRDEEAIHARLRQEIARTRFVGMGNAAESGTHLLYYFRQENRLSRALFAHEHELLSSAVSDPSVDLIDPELKRVVFIDDLCGSGEQALRYSDSVLRDLRSVAAKRGRDLQFQYLVLFGTTAGLDRARAESDFDVVDAVSKIDATYYTFGDQSRVYRKPPQSISRDAGRSVAHAYGSKLWPRWPLGYEGSELLIAFHHNVPDNTLPILWFDEGDPPWTPAFPRYPKIG